MSDALDARRLAALYARVSGPTSFARATPQSAYLDAAQRMIDAVYRWGLSDTEALRLSVPLLPANATAEEADSWGDFCLWALNRIAKDD